MMVTQLSFVAFIESHWMDECSPGRKLGVVFLVTPQAQLCNYSLNRKHAGRRESWFEQLERCRGTGREKNFEFLDIFQP